MLLDLLAPELILLLPQSLSLPSLNALAQTCQRLHGILQAELESRLTSELRCELLLWAATSSKPHVITKLLSAPYLMDPDDPACIGTPLWVTPLYAAAAAGNIEIVGLLLAAGANPNKYSTLDSEQPLHGAVKANNLEMVNLLLDHGAPIDDHFGHAVVYYQHGTQNALHYACAQGYLGLVRCLVARSADIRRLGCSGTALGFAVKAGQVDVVRFLLERGANASEMMPQWYPGRGDLLFIATGLQRYGGEEKLEDLPLNKDRKQLIALLLGHGASTRFTLSYVSSNLQDWAKRAKHTEAEYLQVVQQMLDEAEGAVPEVLAGCTSIPSVSI